MNYYHSQFKQAIFNEHELLAELPPAISSRVTRTLYSPYIMRIPMFRGLGAEVRSMICGLVQHIELNRDTVVYSASRSSSLPSSLIVFTHRRTMRVQFCQLHTTKCWCRSRLHLKCVITKLHFLLCFVDEGDIGTEMYFVIVGEVEVERSGNRLGFLSRGAFFGEAPVIEAIRGKGDEFQRRFRTCVLSHGRLAISWLLLLDFTTA